VRVADCSPDKLIPARIILPLVTTLLISCGMRMSAQMDSSPSTEFTDVTKSAGIKFVHFKGNQGVSINLEEFGPAVRV
jgi:hypothetical protein